MFPFFGKYRVELLCNPLYGIYRVELLCNPLFWYIQSSSIGRLTLSNTRVTIGHLMVIKGHLLTVGPKIYGTIVFIHFSSQDASILKFSVPITIKLSHDNLDKMRVYKNPDNIQVCSKFNSISKNCCFGNAITWL